MDAKRAAEVLRRTYIADTFQEPISIEDGRTACRIGAQALEALRWWFDEDHEPEREAVRIKRDEAGIRWTSDQWIAAVLDAMEKEGKG